MDVVSCSTGASVLSVIFSTLLAYAGKLMTTKGTSPKATSFSAQNVVNAATCDWQWLQLDCAQ